MFYAVCYAMWVVVTPFCLINDDDDDDDDNDDDDDDDDDDDEVGFLHLRLACSTLSIPCKWISEAVK